MPYLELVRLEAGTDTSFFLLILNYSDRDEITIYKSQHKSTSKITENKIETLLYVQQGSISILKMENI